MQRQFFIAPSPNSAPGTQSASTMSDMQSSFAARACYGGGRCHGVIQKMKSHFFLQQLAVCVTFSLHTLPSTARILGAQVIDSTRCSS
jgi:hypothetical protein